MMVVRIRLFSDVIDQNVVNEVLLMDNEGLVNSSELNKKFFYFRDFC